MVEQSEMEMCSGCGCPLVNEKDERPYCWACVRQGVKPREPQIVNADGKKTNIVVGSLRPQLQQDQDIKPNSEQWNKILESQAMKYDAGKTRYDLIPVEPLQRLAEVFTYGADKYSDRNWEKGLTYSRVYAATQRHLNAFWGGEYNDKESGLSHLSHAMCGIMFLQEYEIKGTGTDDRNK